MISLTCHECQVCFLKTSARVMSSAFGSSLDEKQIELTRYYIHRSVSTCCLLAEVHCPPIVTLKNISLSPPACGKRSMSQGSTCLLTCGQGYTLQGNRKAVCLGSGNWTANVQKVNCTGKCVCVSFFLMKKFSS